jgi:hypothetical protein
VALSEETPFQRKFSSVYDALQHGEFDFDLLQQALLTFQPDDSEQIAGYEVYAVDCTPNERPEARTLEDRGSLKAQKNEPVRYGHIILVGAAGSTGHILGSACGCAASEYG